MTRANPYSFWPTPDSPPDRDILEALEMAALVCANGAGMGPVSKAIPRLERHVRERLSHLRPGAFTDAVIAITKARQHAVRTDPVPSMAERVRKALEGRQCPHDRARDMVLSAFDDGGVAQWDQWFPSQQRVCTALKAFCDWLGDETDQPEFGRQLHRLFKVKANGWITTPERAL